MRIIEQLRWFGTNGVRWGGAVAIEVAMLPVTLRHVRQGMVALSALPPQLQEISHRLEATSATVAAHVPELSRLVGDVGEALPKLETAVGDGLLQHVEHLDVVVEELSGKLTTALGAIPGVRRSIRAD